MSEQTQLRPITPDDIIKESDRNYDLGRKHASGEVEELRVKPLIAALQAIDKLTCNCPCMSLQAQKDFDNHPEAMAYKVELAKVILEIRSMARASLAINNQP